MSGGTLDVVDPATGDRLAEVPNMGAGETREAVASAAAAMQTVSSLAQRRGWLKSIAGLLMAEQEELARLITLENGKTLTDSLAEISYAAAFFTACSDNLQFLEPEVLGERIRGCQWHIHHCPAGVAGLITPWNFPVAMMAKKLSSALGAGCATVCKPDEKTPLSVIAWWGLMEKVGLPPGMANLVIGEPGPIGHVLCTHPEVRMIHFTGSTEVGRVLAAQCAPHIKRLGLELGGNAPFIVFPDADVPAAVDALIPNKFRGGGQTCVCTNRVYVHADVIGSFTDAVVGRVDALRAGNGLEAGSDMGPLINRRGFEKVSRQVRDALDRGAKRLVGDDPAWPGQDWGAFFPPTVLTGITPEMEICREETFGPVVAIAEFRDEESVISLANSTAYGLAAYVFTGDDECADRVISRLRFGHVGLNTGTGPTPEAPFGGVKLSGYGREGGREGLLEYCESQVVAEHCEEGIG